MKKHTANGQRQAAAQVVVKAASRPPLTSTAFSKQTKKSTSQVATATPTSKRTEFASQPRPTKKKTQIDHTHCECMVAPRGPHMGLWCVEHQAYIKFLSRKDQEILRHTDIVWLATEPHWVKKKAINAKSDK